MRTSVSFTKCPECGVPVGSGRGMASHRKAQHGVKTTSTKRTTRPRRLTLAERLAKLEELS